MELNPHSSTPRSAARTLQQFTQRQQQHLEILPPPLVVVAVVVVRMRKMFPFTTKRCARAHTFSHSQASPLKSFSGLEHPLTHTRENELGMNITTYIEWLITLVAINPTPY